MKLATVMFKIALSTGDTELGTMEVTTVGPVYTVTERELSVRPLSVTDRVDDLVVVWNCSVIHVRVV